MFLVYRYIVHYAAGPFFSLSGELPPDELEKHRHNINIVIAALQNDSDRDVCGLMSQLPTAIYRVVESATVINNSNDDNN